MGVSPLRQQQGNSAFAVSPLLLAEEEGFEKPPARTESENHTGSSEIAKKIPTTLRKDGLADVALSHKAPPRSEHLHQIM